MNGLVVCAVELDPFGMTSEQGIRHELKHELVICAAGSIVVELGDELVELGKGDSVDFSSTTRHRMRNASDIPSEFLWIVQSSTHHSRRA